MLGPKHCLHAGSHSNLLRFKMRLTLANVLVYQVRVLRVALSIACELSHLYKAITTLKAIFVLWAEASFTGWVASDADVIDLVIEETYRFTVCNTDCSVFAEVDEEESWWA